MGRQEREAVRDRLNDAVRSALEAENLPFAHVEGTLLGPVAIEVTIVTDAQHHEAARRVFKELLTTFDADAIPVRPELLTPDEARAAGKDGGDSARGTATDES